MIYSAGNFIECTTDTPYLQIGEHKYGKPVLDRAVSYGMDLYDALKVGLISINSTMRSNLSVGMPIDLLVVRRDTCDAELIYRIEPASLISPTCASAGRRLCAPPISPSLARPTATETISRRRPSVAAKYGISYALAEKLKVPVYAALTARERIRARRRGNHLCRMRPQANRNLFRSIVTGGQEHRQRVGA